MSILDLIANPQVPSYLENIKVMETLKDRDAARRAQEVQSGALLQEMQLKREGVENKRRGYQAISEAFKPQTMQSTPAIEQNQNIGGGPTPDQQQKQQFFNSYRELTTQQIKQANTFSQLRNVLLTIPGMGEETKIVDTIANNMYTHVQDQSKEDWENATQMIEAVGNKFELLSELETKGDYAQAQRYYGDLKKTIRDDSRVQGNPYSSEFFNSFQEYYPGLGNYLYATTQMGHQIRKQYLEDQLAYGEDLEAVSQGLHDKSFKESTPEERMQTLEYSKTMKRPGVQVNVGKGASEFEKQLGGVSAKKFLDERDSAQLAVEGLQGIYEGRKLLDSGVITGFGANFIVNMGKALRQVGVNLAENDIDNTNAFVASQAKQVATIIKQFGAGTGLSDADREYALKAAGGDINLTEGSIRKIFDINERAYQNVIKLYNQRASKIPANIVPYDLKVQMPKQKSTAYSVTAPNGKTYTFPDQQSLDNFKNAAGIH